MKKRLALATLCTLASILRAQTQPATQPVMTNINVALAAQITDLTADHAPFEKVTKFLAETLHCNLVVNWNALQIAGVTRNTSVNFSLHNASFTEALRDLIEATPTSGIRLNYSVTTGVIVITTDAELGKSPTLKFTDISRQLLIGYDEKPDASFVDDHSKTLLAALRTDLSSSGEIPTGDGRDILIKGQMLVLTQPERGHLRAGNVLQAFSGPTAIAGVPAPARLTLAAKKTETTLAAMCGRTQSTTPFLLIAKSPATYLPDTSVVYLPGATDELAKANPDIDYEVTPGGALLIGPRQVMSQRTSLVVYDLRQLIRRETILNPKTARSPADITASVVNILQKKVPADWGELEKSPSSITPYAGLLVIFATKRTHRAIVPVLQDLFK